MSPIIKISKIGDVGIEPRCNIWQYDCLVMLCWYRINSAKIRLKVNRWQSELRDEVTFDDGMGLNFIHDIYKRDVHLNNELMITCISDLKFFNFTPAPEDDYVTSYTSSIHRHISKIANVE